MNNEEWINKLLADSGITINGKNSWDPQIINSKFFDRVAADGSLGLGESYMEGWWECKNVDQFIYKLLLAKIDEKVELSLPVVLNVLMAKMFNLQAKNRAFEVAEKHYDLDNEMFAKMLGKTMAYSCGYWFKAKNLDAAEIAKFDLICRKLNLKKGQRILDIGCGWGSFAKYAAENYNVSVVGVTVSKEQAEFARKLCKGFDVEFEVMDYRDLNDPTSPKGFAGRGKFDNIVSVGMFEHVGLKNYKTYFEVAKKCLNENGLFLLHTIGLAEGTNTDPWTNKYIFPNGMLPFLEQISSNARKIFVIEDVHNFGAYYDKTLMAWHTNFIAAWPKFKDKYSEKFFRMWNYYLLSCAGAFRAREIQLWQIVLSPNGVPGGYESVR